jgi:hypothetical protein
VSALRAASWWRLWYATGWLRWKLPVSRDTALRLAEEQSDAYYQLVNRKVDALYEVLENVIKAELYAKWDRLGCRPPAPGRAPVTQRDIDDAVAGLIRDARQEFGRGGAR